MDILDILNIWSPFTVYVAPASEIDRANVALALSAATVLTVALAVDTDLVMTLDKATTLTLALSGDPYG